MLQEPERVCPASLEKPCGHSRSRMNALADVANRVNAENGAHTRDEISEHILIRIAEAEAFRIHAAFRNHVAEQSRQFRRHLRGICQRFFGGFHVGLKVREGRRFVRPQVGMTRNRHAISNGKVGQAFPHQFKFGRECQDRMFTGSTQG